MRSYAYHASLRVSQMPCRDLHLFALCGKKHSVHLFMVLSCNSQMPASGGLYFLFIIFFPPNVWTFSQCANVQTNITVSWYCSHLLSHLEKQIWRMNQPRGCRSEFLQVLACGQTLPQMWQFWVSVWKSPNFAIFSILPQELQCCHSMKT